MLFLIRYLSAMVLEFDADRDVLMEFAIRLDG